MKSHVSDQIKLLVCVYTDATSKCETDVADVRDLETLRSRVEHEGESFYTLTLPSFGSDFERCLDQGRVVPGAFRAFYTPKTQAIPAFLQGMLERVFNKLTGSIQDDPCINAIEGVRQIAYTFKKVKRPCSPARVAKAFAGFVSDEQDLERPCAEAHVAYFRSVSKHLWDGVFADFNPFTSIPRHGPGATQDRASGNRKFDTSRWHDRLELHFPLLSNRFTSESAWESEEFENVTIIDEEHEAPVRVITVPKTLKAPRIIAIEPVCMQYTQQAIKAYLYEKLESYALTAGHINFTDQSINRILAQRSSRDQSLATLDLSSASDRVYLPLVETMLEGNELLLSSILACRSKKAKLPDDNVLSLKKFASMGSALCFPIESMYFYTICVGALLDKHKLPVTWLNVKNCTSQVHVYGDDILVPTHAVSTVIEHLQRYYCKVNTTKSFWTGKFRESCGMDAYNGEEVTPTYVRECVPYDRRSAKALISWVETSNLFHLRGYWETAAFMKMKVEHVLGKLPIVSGESSGLGWRTFGTKVSCHRWLFEKKGVQTPNYQRPEVRTWVPATVFRPDRLEGYAALTKCLLKLESGSLSAIAESDSKHLERSARRGVVTLNRRWVPAV